MLIGLVDAQIVTVGQISSPKNPRIAHNSEIVISVRKDCWRNGIGSQMMQELIQFAKENPTIKNISLGVKAANLAGLNLYQKLGFQQVGVHKNFFCIEGEFDDKIIMELYV